MSAIKRIQPIWIWLLGTPAAQAQLAVTVFPPDVADQKAVVPLAPFNGLPQRIEAAVKLLLLCAGL